MSNTRVCYTPQKGIDDVIASKMMGYTPHRVATLRGMYDTAHPDAKLDTSDPTMAAVQLAAFNKRQAINRRKQIRETSTHLAESYRRIKADFSAEERFDRVNMISYMFSKVLDSLQAGTPEVTRVQIANGFTDNTGTFRGGELAVFERVYNDLLTAYEQFTSTGEQEKADKIQKVLDNWPSLVTFARIRLRDTEGLVLGAHENYSAEVDPSNFADEDLSQIFDLSESKREGWQEIAAAISSFGSLGKEVRRFLSGIPVVDEKGQPVVDDLGIPKTLDPVKTHQALLETVRGCNSKESMMNRLNYRALSAKWLGPIVSMLDKYKNRDFSKLTDVEKEEYNIAEQLKTKLFVDLKKNFQPYSIILRAVERGVETFKTKILNQPNTKEALSQYINRAAFGKPLSNGAIYDKNGDVVWGKVQEFRDLMQKYLPAIDKSEEGAAFKTQAFWTSSKANRLAFIKQTARLLDIPMDDTAAEQLLHNSKELRKYLRALSDLNDKILNGLMKGKTDLGKVKYKDFINQTIGGQGTSVSLKDRLKILASLGVKYTEGSRLERACRYNGSKKKGTTYYSDVNPCYLGDEIDAIQEYVEAGDSNGLKEYIRAKYLGTSYFMDDGKILNWWLRDLYEGGVDENSFAANFIAPDRLLGEDGNEFENFTSKTHAQALFVKYFAERQLNRTSPEAWRRDYAEYPIFILGDSGVAKFIKAKRYDCYDSTDKLLEGFYDVYKQERRRMELAKAVNQKLGSEIENFTDNSNRYTFLPFLNPDFKNSKGKIEPKYSRMLSENPTEAEVKAAIKEYMKDAQQDFVNRLVEFGVVTSTTDKNGKVSYYSPLFNQEMAAGKTFEQIIQDYFWNTKFATIQQLQMFTIDPAFYKNTKDLQKRYKEIHAPGAKLDVAARWNGELIAGDNPIERAVYFDDINVNGESIDTEFMNSILYNFAVADESEVASAIARGITTPKEDKKEEAARISELKKLLGKNWDIYKSYQKNTLTDGQGYRSLQSYRKVMIMAGKWDNKMESLYNELQDIRRAYGKNADIPKDVMQRIASLAVSFMPIKPYMYTFENYAVNGNDKLMIPVQHKYAEAVLIPELLPKGSKLRDMAYWMEEHTEEQDGKTVAAPIDLICSTKCVKVGNFGATDISGTNNSDELTAALNSGYTHQLSYSDYRIQTNVPEHINGSQLFGTQVRKLIMAGIRKDGDYSHYTGGKVPKLFKNQSTTVRQLNGNNLIQFYNALIAANIVDSFRTFSKGIASTEDLSDALLQSTISNSRESLDNMLAYMLDDNGDFTIPLFEGGLEHDSAALIFSLFKKLVNKQKINGGSAVQVSAMGITGYAEDGGLQYVVDPKNKKNVLYAKVEVPFDLNYIDDSGNTVQLEYDDWVNEDGTPKVDKDGVPLLEKEFPGILNFIAYRIPTERDYSMINCRVKRFSRKEAGGTIKVPPQGTTIAGFDFDIDKLYFMRRQYRKRSRYIEADFSKDELYSVFAEIYENHPEIKQLLSDIRDASGEYRIVTRQRKNGEEYEYKEYTYPLNHYWEQMLEENPSFVADDNYSKEALFTEAVESLVAKGELESKEGRKEYTNETYNFDRTPMQNSRIARNNMLIDLIQQRLQDPETFKQRYTPGGFKNSSNAARVMRELLFGDLSGITSGTKVDFDKLHKRAEDKASDPEPNYDPSDPSTIIIYNQQNQVAGKLIGIFANQNTNHAFSSLMKTMVVKPGAQFSFCGHSYSDFLHAPAGVDVDLNVAEFLAASVDAVKDPVLNFLNLNTLTADAGATLARLGYTTEEIGLLFNQPIIKEICEYAFNNGAQLSTAIRNVVNNYKKLASSEYAVNPATDFSKERLAESIVGDRLRKEDSKPLSKEEATQQLKIAELFQQIITVSQDLSEFVTNTKFTASNAAGSTFGDYYAQQLKVQDYIDRFGKDEGDKRALSVEMQVSDFTSMPINNNETALTMDDEAYVESLMTNPFAYEQAMFDMNRRALKLISKYYPYETVMYKQMRARMNGLTLFGHLDAATINTLHNDLMTYLLSQQENSRFNGSGDFILTDNDGNVIKRTTNREYYLNDFPAMLYKFKDNHPELESLPIFQFMEFQYDEETKSVSLNIQNVGGLQPYQKDELRDSWAEVAKRYPGIGMGLFMYNFYKLGFTFSPKAFMNLAPTEVKEMIQIHDGMSYVDFLRKIQRGEFGIDYEDFARQFILNHTDNNRFVYTPFGDDKKTILDAAKDKSGMLQSSFVLDISDFGEEAAGFIISDSSLPQGSKLKAFKPVIGLTYNLPDGTQDTIYYMASTENDMGTGKFNVSADGTMRYVAVRKLGVSNVSLQYKSPTQRAETAPAEVAPVEAGNTGLGAETSKEIADMSNDDIIQEVAAEMAKAFEKYGFKDDQNEAISASSLAAALGSNYSREQLEEMITQIRQACRENGIMVLDSEGNPTFGC